jgi:uncharacterized membrane protein
VAIDRARLAPEGTRFGVATAASSAVGLVAGASAGSRAGPDQATVLAALTLLTLSTWCLVYVVVTLVAFVRVDATRLAVLVRPAPTTRLRRFVRGGGDGPGVAVSFASVALAAAVLLPALDVVADVGLRTLLRAVSYAVVPLCWGVLVTSYAVHYLRLHSLHGGLEFPGEHPPRFGDVGYFAVAVATTFGTTDVDVTTRAMRRVVTGNSLLSFAFNTVILALVIAALAA